MKNNSTIKLKLIKRAFTAALAMILYVGSFPSTYGTKDEATPPESSAPTSKTSEMKIPNMENVKKQLSTIPEDKNINYGDPKKQFKDLKVIFTNNHSKEKVDDDIKPTLDKMRKKLTWKKPEVIFNLLGDDAYTIRKRIGEPKFTDTTVILSSNTKGYDPYMKLLRVSDKTIQAIAKNPPKNLKVFKLENNYFEKITSIDALSTLFQNLEEFQLTDPLENVSGVVQMIKNHKNSLKRLGLQFEKFTFPPKEITIFNDDNAMKKRIQLKQTWPNMNFTSNKYFIENCQMETIETLEAIKQCHNLEVLDLTINYVDDAFLKDLVENCGKSLKVIKLYWEVNSPEESKFWKYGNKGNLISLTDDGIKFLFEKCKKLQRVFIHLPGLKISKDLEQYLQDTYPKIEIISIQIPVMFD